MKARIKYMDIAKGIGIICVLLGHTYSGPICILVNTFHMPLFFMISGYFFLPKENLKIKNSAQLLIPYCMTIIAFVVYFLIQGKYADAILWIRGGLYGSGWDYEVPFLIKGVGGIWFFLALFWVKIIVNEIMKFNERFQIWLAVVITYAGVKTYLNFVFPWSIQNGMTAPLFFILGYYARKEKLFERINYTYFLVFSIMWFYCYKYYGMLTMVNCNIPNIMTVVGAVCGSMVIIHFSMLIETKLVLLGNALAYLGK